MLENSEQQIYFEIPLESLDQAATNSLVRALQHGVEELQLGCYSGRVRLHTQTLVQYDGRGRCGEVSWHRDHHCASLHGHSMESPWSVHGVWIQPEIQTWAARIGWGVEAGSDSIVISRKSKH